MYDLLIKGGYILDTEHQISEERDLAVSEGTIVQCKKNIQEDAQTVIDAAGCIVAPGLIDYHLHLFADGSEHGVTPDLSMLPNGVTTGVDAGTCGCCNYEAFHKQVVVNAKANVKACINVSDGGLSSFSVNENLDPVNFHVEAIRKLVKKYSGEIVGVKIRSSRAVTAPLTSEPLRETIKAAESLGLPVVVHVTDPSFSIEELALMLRPGDVFCHMYHGKGETILDANGSVLPGIRKARERGVVFDACNGRGNFSFRPAIPAMREGFFPDILSTDTGPLTNYREPVISLPYLMSKYLAMGASLKDVFRMTTSTPAHQIGEPELGTLVPGTIADIAVFRLKKKEIVFRDYEGNHISGNQILVPQMTVREGTIVWRQTDF